METHHFFRYCAVGNIVRSHRDRNGIVRCGTPAFPGGAAGAYLAVDMENELSVFFGCHLLSSPAAKARARLCRFVRAELSHPQDIENIFAELKELPEYHLTY